MGFASWVWIGALALTLAACATAPASTQNPHLNQHGFLPDGGKYAVVVNDAPSALGWRLRDRDGRTLAEGQTTPFGLNAGSGQHVHGVDFSHVTAQGAGLTLHVGAAASHPFAIAPNLYDKLARDAFAFFYHQRASIAIEARHVGVHWARPIAHAPDTAGCVERDTLGNQWRGCPYTLDLSRGWYDAGDHGKYVVNGGISVWTLLNFYERTRARGAAVFPDGALAIPESGNGVNDLLDEVRWQMDFMLAMQVPEGVRLDLPLGDQTATLNGLRFTNVDASGMAHHKMHDETWTPVPTPPHLDPEKRVLSYPSTAATLNLAANAAQCARIWAGIDAAFAARCLSAARRAYDAALRVPDAFAYNLSPGSGGYGDVALSDEFYWAATELYLTTGQARYGADMRNSPHWLAAGDFSWSRVDTLGTISLAIAGDGDDQAGARAALTARGAAFADESAGQGYRIPFNRSYVWGSNADLANRALLLALAYDFSGEARYRDEVINAMDYMLGRNPLDQSYVSGYGARPMTNPHHRFWAPSRDSALPPPPPGVLAGGSNFNRPADSVAERIYPQCHAQTCYADDIEAYSLNEVAINWNAPFFWIAAFLAEPIAAD